MLKLSLPGVDPTTIPTLTAKQVARIPAKFLDFLQTLGRVDDYGDLTIITVEDDRHNFTIISIAGWVVNGRLEHGELKVEPLESRSDREPVAYNPSTHDQDITFVATAETHARFLQRLGLYIFILGVDMKDLQEYLCKTICTEYPVYEAELIALLTAVFEHTDGLRGLDPNLASFVSERMFCLHKILVTNTAVLPLLCKAISAKDRFLALAGRANHSALALALTELRNDVGEVAETDALLTTFIERNPFREDAVQSVQPVPLVTSSTQGKRKRGRPSKAELEAKSAKLDGSAAPSRAAGNESVAPIRVTTHDTLTTPSIAPNPVETPANPEVVLGDSVLSHGHPSVQIDVEGRSTSNDLTQNFPITAADQTSVNINSPHIGKARRPHPGQSLWIRRPSAPSGSRALVRATRPEVDNEYWSVTHDEWDALPEAQKRAYTHAGNICETEAGMVALESCSVCRELGHLCEIYTDDDLHRNFGKSCARCRIRFTKCSLTEGKKRNGLDGT